MADRSESALIMPSPLLSNTSKTCLRSSSAAVYRQKSQVGKEASSLISCALRDALILTELLEELHCCTAYAPEGVLSLKPVHGI